MKHINVKTNAQEKSVLRYAGYKNPYSYTLLNSKNIIFHGAPGTGKTYLAKEIAADIISNGHCDKYDDLSEEQKRQVEFVQFHPSYDYTDFVEGLRPTVNKDGSMGFELQDGIFKKFVVLARMNYKDSPNEDFSINDSSNEDFQKSNDEPEKGISGEEAMKRFFSRIRLGVNVFYTSSGNKFKITSIDYNGINIYIPGNKKSNKITLNIDRLRKMLESHVKFTRSQDVSDFFKILYSQKQDRQEDSYYFAIYNEIMSNGTTVKEITKKKESPSKVKTKVTNQKKYIFIIDEINRGEISKIFGELFFAIDPGYRGKDGSISTQYANMHPDEKFYIPDNVYIIGTMNDIDRSVDSFDFAMRRRFRFVEIKADDRLEMLSSLGEYKEEARQRMNALNEKIARVEDLNENYHIGPAYFLKLKDLNFDFDLLWTDYLQPLLQEYVRGMPDEKGMMNQFAKAYSNKKSTEDDVNETAED